MAETISLRLFCVGCYSDNMNSKISGYVWNVQEELQRNTELQEHVVKRVVEKDLRRQ
jgi:hypothetical protein